jgi:uncharacterized protein (DUF2249 family)
MSEAELDVRELRPVDRHPAVFATYDALPVGGAFVLVNDHDPRRLREEFDTDHPGGYGWEYLDEGPRRWRVRIRKLASTPLPRRLVDTASAARSAAPDAAGAVWSLRVRERDLDSNIIALPPGGTIETHTGPDLDVLVHVLHGSGELTTERDVVRLDPGALVWLPRRSRRRFAAGADGLRYLTVHRRRRALVLHPAASDASPDAASPPEPRIPAPPH